VPLSLLNSPSAQTIPQEKNRLPKIEFGIRRDELIHTLSPQTEGVEKYRKGQEIQAENGLNILSE
jgi:hypothetical protein